MKNNLTINSIAKSNLIKRKGRYVLLIIGIILAMVFSSSVLFFLSCMQTSWVETERNMIGMSDRVFYEASEELMQKGVKYGVIEDYGFAYVIGNGYSESSGEDHSYAMAYFDEKGKEISYLSFIEGGYPQNENEIAVEKATLARLAPDAQIGDEITMTVHSQNGMEVMTKAETKTYKLVGIARNKKSNIDFYDDMPELFNYFPSVFVSPDSRTVPGGKELAISYIVETELSRLGENPEVNLYSFLESNGANVENCFFVGSSSNFYNTVRPVITENIVFIIIFAVILLIASCMGIVNAFSSDLNDRKKQIGMLRTVGATKRQIINMFGREAFFISLISAPVSIVISYFLVLGITKLLGENFVFVPNWWVLIACAVFGVICVMSASLIPLLKASSISPMQAIRNIEYTRKLKNKKIKTQKSFDTSRLLGKRNVVFNKVRQVVVCTILVVSIVFSCYGFSFTTSMYKEGNPYHNGYDFEMILNGISYGTDNHSEYNRYINFINEKKGFSDKDFQNVLSKPNVKSAHGAKAAEAFLLFDGITDYFLGNYSENAYMDVNPTPLNDDVINEYLYDSYNNRFGELKERFGYTKEILPSGIEAYSAHLFEQLENSVIDGKINIEKINSGEEVILVAPQKIAYEPDPDNNGSTVDSYRDERIESDKKYSKTAELEIRAGDKITVSVLSSDSEKGRELPADCTRTDKEVTVGAVISNLPGWFNSDEIGIGILRNIKVITTLGGMTHFCKCDKYENMNINLKENCEEQAYLEMQDFLESLSADAGNVRIDSLYRNIQETKRLYNSILFAIIGIVILLLSIAASMINNTMSSQIRNGKRAIGTLRAVGATEGTLVKSYVYQLMSTFLWSFGIGFGSYIISFIIQMLYIKSKNEQPFLTFSLWQTIIACLILFAVCSLNLWLKIRKEMKNSIIDNIREL